MLFLSNDIFKGSPQWRATSWRLGKLLCRNFWYAKYGRVGGIPNGKQFCNCIATWNKATQRWVWLLHLFKNFISHLSCHKASSKWLSRVKNTPYNIKIQSQIKIIKSPPIKLFSCPSKTSASRVGSPLGGSSGAPAKKALSLVPVRLASAKNGTCRRLPLVLFIYLLSFYPTFHLQIRGS